jgi:hypothetical protein
MQLWAITLNGRVDSGLIFGHAKTTTIAEFLHSRRVRTESRYSMSGRKLYDKQAKAWKTWTALGYDVVKVSVTVNVPTPRTTKGGKRRSTKR